MINKEFISRLLKYSNVLNKLKSLGLTRVFSDNLGDAAGLAPSQVRRDLSLLKISGNKRGGYNIDELTQKLSAALGKNEEQKVIIVGCGNIGRALINYNGFAKDGLRIVAGFDIDASKIGAIVDIPVYPLEELEDFIRKNNIKVGVIAAPETAAGEIYEHMVKAGIKGVLNFARVRLRDVEGCIVNTINIELKIENLFYFVHALEKEKPKTTPKKS